MADILKSLILTLSCACIPVSVMEAQDSSYRWQQTADSTGIFWTPGADIPHYDHIEMSGSKAAFVLRWGVREDRSFDCERSLVFPLLRRIPNNTHASLVRKNTFDITSLVLVGNKGIRDEQVISVRLNGSMEVKSLWTWCEPGTSGRYARSLEMTRAIFPSVEKQAMCEIYTLRNLSKGSLSVSVPASHIVWETDASKGVDGAYAIVCDVSPLDDFTLAPGKSVSFQAVFRGCLASEAAAVSDISAIDEYSARMSYVHEVADSSLILDTPDDVIDGMFHMAKIRASESIIDTKGGLMHAPGGEVFYAAIWANDQAEYVNPFFPYLGYNKGNESAMNSFRHFARFMNPEYHPLPSSIIAEGDDIWAGAGDRGDAAMIAYGASRFALSSGSRDYAEELWPLISWCLEFCRRKVTDDGVVASDSDELEGRFPSGDANLCTSTLYYDALLSASMLARDLGRPSAEISVYRTQASRLAKSIERYFGATISGYATYRYYDGNDKLRSWICMPLIVGLDSRAEATISALMGPELMTENGLLTEQGSKTFWDRTTLYSLRAIYNAGYPDRATSFLHDFSSRRLLGDHVPYCIEAWPEGSQRHLSAESGLYCRIVTEGIFGIRPTGFRSFDMTPSMPAEWNEMSLKKIKAYGHDFDLTVRRSSQKKLEVSVRDSQGFNKTYRITEGESLTIKFKD